MFEGLDAPEFPIITIPPQSPGNLEPGVFADVQQIGDEALPFETSFDPGLKKIEEPLCPKTTVPGDNVMVAPLSTRIVPVRRTASDQVSDPEIVPDLVIGLPVTLFPSQIFSPTVGDTKLYVPRLTIDMVFTFILNGNGG